jgi:hypothetical protein
MAVDCPVTGSQIEIDGAQEDPLSQVDNPTDVESNVDAGNNVSLHQAARDVSGTNLTSHNSFALLDDDIIHDRALEIGVNPVSLYMEKINYLKDLEQARHAIAVVQSNQEIESDSEPERILLLGFGREQDIDEDDFTPVISRRSRKKRKSGGRTGRWRETPAKSGGSFVGAQSKSCAAQGKVNNVHPLSDIVTGPRCRKKNLKYL